MLYRSNPMMHGVAVEQISEPCNKLKEYVTSTATKNLTDPVAV